MKSSFKPFLRVLLGSGALAGAALSSPLAAAPVGAGIDLMYADAGGLTLAEQAFFEQARDLTRQQRRLADLGLAQARMTELREHAQRVGSDFRELAHSLDGLVRRQGIVLPGGTDITSEAYRDLAALGGPAFDQRWTRTMLALHEATIAQFERATAEARHSDVREFAAAQLPMLREHRNRLVRLVTAY